MPSVHGGRTKYTTLYYKKLLDIKALFTVYVRILLKIISYKFHVSAVTHTILISNDLMVQSFNDYEICDKVRS
jgi:hypothetical protein